MRLSELIIGGLLLASSIAGYTYSTNLTEKAQDMINGSIIYLFPNIKLENTQSYLLQMGYPSIQIMSKIVQMGSVAIMLIGIGLLCFGSMAKKRIPKDFSNVTIQTRTIHDTLESMNQEKSANTRGIHILKERLARGEITEREFEKLRKFFE